MNTLINFSGKTIGVFLLTLCLVTLYSCKDATPTVPDYTITLDQSSARVEIGETIELKPIFNGGEVTDPAGRYNWKSDNPAIVSAAMNKDFSVTLTGLQAGKATIKFIAIDRLEVVATYEITVNPKPDGITRILTIGNSFSADAVENYLYDLAKAANIPVIIGNLAIASGSLEQHISNAESGAAPYIYTKIDASGAKTTTFDNPIEPILTSEPWDYISFQQVSSNSGMYETFEASLPALVEYVKQLALNPNAKYVLHQTWAYAQHATHAGFANYGNDQQTMYEAIVDTYNKAQQLADIDIIVPAGTAIQNGRTSFIGDNFNRDGSHLEESYGRYTVACTWFEKLFGQSVVGNTFKPSAVSDYNKDIAQHAAHFAVLEPNQVTELVDYQEGDRISFEDGDAIQVSFGLGNPPGWNVLTFEQAVDGVIPDLINADGDPTGVSLTVVERFGGRNDTGAGTTNTPLNMPGNVSSSSLYGNSRAAFNGILVEQSVIKFTGLEKNATYDLCFFGSRMSVTDNRDTKFIAKGKNEVSVSQNTAVNSSDIACAEGVEADDNGEITVTITMGENNTNSTGFYYINAMRIVHAN